MDAIEPGEAPLAAVTRELSAPTEIAQLETLFRAHYRRALKAAYRITGNMADAEDVAQAVFLHVAQQARSGHDIDNPESYVYRAAINGALDLLRRRCREGAVAVDENLPAYNAADGLFAARELRDSLRQALATLASNAAEMFVLRYIEGYDNRQIARLMNTSRATVAVTLYRTRTRVRSSLRNHMRGKL